MRRLTVVFRARFVNDRALAQAMGTAGRQRVLDHFTLDRQVRAYLTVYRRDAAGRAAAQLMGWPL